MAAFVRLYLQTVDRRLSPIYLVGESYGGFRAALLASRLQGESGVTPNGVVLISPALEFALLERRGLRTPPMGLVAYRRWRRSASPTRASAGAVRSRQAEARGRLRAQDYLSARGLGPRGGPAGPCRAEVARLTGLPAQDVVDQYARVPARSSSRPCARQQGKSSAAMTARSVRRTPRRKRPGERARPGARSRRRRAHLRLPGLSSATRSATRPTSPIGC